MSTEHYAWKEIPGSSHDLLRRRIRSLPPGRRLLDLGAAGGHLGRAVRDRCAYLAGVEPDPALPSDCREGYDDWRSTDALSAGAWDAPFDVVVCGDVLEHLPRPEALLERIREWLAPSGTLLVSLPNVANVTVRAALLLGRFPYAEQGHPRPDAPALLHAAVGSPPPRGRGLPRRACLRRPPCPTSSRRPFLGRAPLAGPVRAFASGSARLWPTMFGYQFVIEARK